MLTIYVKLHTTELETHKSIMFGKRSATYKNSTCAVLVQKGTLILPGLLFLIVPSYIVN